MVDDAPENARDEAPTQSRGRGGPLPLMGLARLMRMAFEGADLQPLGAELLDRARADHTDANALMDLATVLQLRSLRQEGLAVQAQALALTRTYRLAASRPAALRVLALMSDGDLMSNAPLPFLFEDSDVALTMLHINPGEALPGEPAGHDVVIVAASESDENAPLLRALDTGLAGWRAPVVNRARHILATSREQAWKVLDGAAGVVMPASARAPRAALQAAANGQASLAQWLAGAAFPLIARPVDSHAGHGLERIDTLPGLADYLARNEGDEFFVSPFIDYRDPDGLYRKYRVVLVDGDAFPGHMGVSSHWMIHYLNAGMTDSAGKRAEEARFMSGFDEGFGARHAGALRTVAAGFGLEYLVIDCAQAPDGRLLVFEVDPGAVLHTMDAPEMFPYKRPQMTRLFAAYRAMLGRVAARV